MGEYAQRAQKRARRMLELLDVVPVREENPLVQLVEAVLEPQGNLTPPPQVPITEQEWWENWKNRPLLPQLVNRVVDSEELKVPLNKEGLLLWAARVARLVIAE